MSRPNRRDRRTARRPKIPRGFEAVVRADGIGVIVPITPEHGSPTLREGLARRRLVLLAGRCPCGATPFSGIARPGLEPAPLMIVFPQHRDGCAATADEVEDWVSQRWGWSA